MVWRSVKMSMANFIRMNLENRAMSGELGTVRRS